MEHPDFLDTKYPDLPGSKPVERAVAQAKNDPERDFAPHTRDERIQAYLNRIDHIIDDERGWELLKNKIINEFIIDTDDEETLSKIAHGLYEAEKRLAIEQGRLNKNDIERMDREVETGNALEQYKSLAMEKGDIQERSLTSWLDYLHQNDAQYPTWFRYFVLRNLKIMGTLDKEKGAYGKRTDYTVAPFPELNEEALGFVYRMLTTGIGHQEYVDEEDKAKREQLTQLITKKDFIKLYTFAQIETAGQLNRESLQGEWVKYPQGSDHHALEDTLRGKGTGWCTAEGSARSQLEGGDFYVYYTRGTGGTYSEPRVAIRMEGDTVAEVRGVNHRQELEPALLDVAAAKYRPLPGGEKFDKKSLDVKHLSLLMKKQEKGESFTKEDLIFLYEIDQPIEGFGYDKHPRVKELRDKRNPEEDMLAIFDCTKADIAHNAREVTDTTKAYVGTLFPGIFKTHIEHIYTTFPEGELQRYNLEIGGKTKADYEKALTEKNIQINTYARQLLESPEFVTLPSGEQVSLVRLTVGDLGFSQGATTKEIYERANEWGLELCPPEVGPALRLAVDSHEWMAVGMKQITVQGGYPRVFYLNRYGADLWLGTSYAKPSSWWRTHNQFVFRTRKSES